MEPDRSNQSDHGNGDASYFGPAPPSQSHVIANDAPPQGDMTPPTPVAEQPPEVPRPPQHSGSRHQNVSNSVRQVQLRPLNRHESVIRLRRLQNLPPQAAGNSANTSTGRRRSTSEPQRSPSTSQEAGAREAQKPLPPLPEAAAVVIPNSEGHGSEQAVAVIDPKNPGGLHRLLGRRRQTVAGNSHAPRRGQDCYDDKIVDFLDVIGTYHQPPCASPTSHTPGRSRGCHPVVHYQCSELTVCTLAGPVGESATDV